MLQQTIYILNAIRTESLIAGLGVPVLFGLESSHKSQISTPLAPSIFFYMLMRENYSQESLVQK